MGKPPLTPLLLLVVILAGCNNGLSGLDHGKVRVNGLAKPQPLTPSVIRSANQGNAANAGEKQTRQTVTFTISAEALAQGSEFSVRRRMPEPAQDLTVPTKIPSPGESVVAGDLRLERQGDGEGLLSFYAATMLKGNALSYGDNTLQFSVLNNGVIVSQLDLQVKIRDFDLASPVVISSIKASNSTDGTLQQGWLSTLKQSEVSELPNGGDSPTVLRSGFFSIINP